MTLIKSILVASMFSMAAGLSNAATVSIGTNPQGSLAYAIGSAIAKEAIEKSDVRMRVVPEGGPTVTIPLVNNGDLDFSIANSDSAAFAFKGSQMFPRPNKNLRVVALLVPLHAGLLVRADSNIHSIKDLSGKRVSSDFLKQKILGIDTEALLASAGITYDNVEKVPAPNGLRAVQDLESGNVDAVFYSLSSGRTKQAEATIREGLRALPVDTSNEAIARLKKIAPGSTVVMDKPRSTLIGVKKEQGVFTSGYVLMASKSTPDELVYAVTKALYENKSALVTSAKIFNEFDPRAMNKYDAVPLHSGAQKFYAEVGLKNN